MCASLQARPFSLIPSGPTQEAARAAAAPCGERTRAALIEGPRARLGAIERPALVPLAPRAGDRPVAAPGGGRDWTLGDPAIDARLGPAGLDPAGLHEVKPLSGGAVAAAAAAAFALRLAARRLHQSAGARSAPPPRLLCCATAAATLEQGHLYGPGLAGLGLDPRALLIVETARTADTLWALEEGLKSGSLALVIGMLDRLALTPARRLSLAARQHRTPCLLLTCAHGPAAGATTTRWRIAPAASAPHPFDPRAPGAPRYAATLERCRRAAQADAPPLVLEWSDETHRFRVAPNVEHRALEAPRARSRAG